MTPSNPHDTLPGDPAFTPTGNPDPVRLHGNGLLEKIIDLSGDTFRFGLDVVSSEEPKIPCKLLQWIWILGLFVLGIGAWWFFLNGGNIQFNLHDWVEASKRYAFLQDAIQTG